MYSKLFLLFLLIISGCSTVLFLPDENDAKLMNTSVQELLNGRELYISKCGGCHNLYLPNQYDANRWNEILAEMKVRSKLTDEEQKKIFIYLNCALKKHSQQAALPNVK